MMTSMASAATTTATKEDGAAIAAESNNDESSEPPRPTAIPQSRSAKVDHDDAAPQREEPRRDLPAPANGGSHPPTGPTSTSTAEATDGTTTTTTTMATTTKKKVQLSLGGSKKKKKSTVAAKSLTTLDGVTESEAASDRRRRDAEEAARRRRDGEDAPLVIPLRSQNDGSLPSSSVANGANADEEAARALEREAEARGSGRGDDDGGGAGSTNFSVSGGLVIGSSSSAGDGEPRPASQEERKGGENRGKNGKPLPLLLASRPAALNDPGSQNLDDDEKFRLDIDHRPTELDVSSDAYASVPIGEFGAALLRGMGWKGDTTTTENDKGGGEVQRPRHHRLGLGAAPRPIEIDPSTPSNRPGGKRHRARKPGEYERDEARAEAEDKERRRREALEAERRRRDLQETLQVGSVVRMVEEGGDNVGTAGRAVVVKVGGVPGLNRILVRFEKGREPTTVRRGDARLLSRDELDRDPFRDGKQVNGNDGGATKTKTSRRDEERLSGGGRDRDEDGSSRSGGRGREERDSSRRRDGAGDDRGKDRGRGGSRSRSRERNRERSRKASRRREEPMRDDDDRRSGSDRRSEDRHRDRDRDRDRDDRRGRKRRRGEGDESSRGGRDRSSLEDRHRGTGDRESRDGRDRASHERRHDRHHWLIPHIRVRVITRKFDPRGGVDGRNRRTHSSSHYKRKGVVVDVTRAGECTIRMDGVGTLLEGVAERHLETAPPREGGEVVVLSSSSSTSTSSSNHLHARGRLLERDTDRNRCAVQLFDDMSVLTLSLDDVAEWCGPPDEAGG